MIQKPKKWKRIELALILEKLEMYSCAGFGLDEALSLARRGAKKSQNDSIGQIVEAVRRGERLSNAFGSVVRLPAAVRSLIAHGEDSGGLPVALAASRALLEREDELIKKSLSSMAYPGIIAVFSLAITIALVRGVMPQIVPMLISLHAELPFITRAVIFISNGFSTYGLLGIFVFISIFIAAVRYYRKSKTVKRFVHVSISSLPVIGRLSLTLFFSLFLRSCGALIEAGLPSADAFGRSVMSSSFIPVHEILKKNEEGIFRGAPISAAFESSKIPGHVPALVAAGEKSGTLGSSMLRAADMLDRDLERSIHRLTALLEPSMMIVMGGVVGCIALSIMLPIYDVSKALQR